MKKIRWPIGWSLITNNVSLVLFLIGLYFFNSHNRSYRIWPQCSRLRSQHWYPLGQPCTQTKFSLYRKKRRKIDYAKRNNQYCFDNIWRNVKWSQHKKWKTNLTLKWDARLKYFYISFSWVKMKNDSRNRRQSGVLFSPY